MIKLAKLCNLRCTYCYEFESLADPTRMQPEQLEALFENVADYSVRHDRRAEFVWHGGEPLLAPPGYFEELFDRQARIFEAAGIEFSNSIQTNLYKIRSDTFDLLRRFTQVGVSIDLFGDLRVTANGQPAQRRVLENMDRLRDEGINFGCITVLTPEVARNIDEVFDFYATSDLSFRLLPIYRSAFSDQHREWEIPREDVEKTLMRLFDLMMEREAGISVAPIDGYVINVLRQFTRSAKVAPYPRGETPEALFIVDTDGSAYASAYAYDPTYAYGNLFNRTGSFLKGSEGYEKTLAERQDRLRGCQGCQFHDCCSGIYLAEATTEQRSLGPDGTFRCPDARAVQQHIVDWFENSGLIRPDLSVLDVEKLMPYLPDMQSEQRHVAY